ncbi:MAG: hypothetical protein WCK47_00060 [bacterium]|nr:hypothetical protein [Candidatus Sumerlaeota bacterium]
MKKNGDVVIGVRDVPVPCTILNRQTTTMAPPFPCRYRTVFFFSM